jgi:hypothetical protein
VETKQTTLPHVYIYTYSIYIHTYRYIYAEIIGEQEIKQQVCHSARGRGRGDERGDPPLVPLSRGSPI